MGTDQLKADANTNVLINTGLPVNRDVIAIVNIDGQVAAWKPFNIG